MKPGMFIATVFGVLCFQSSSVAQQTSGPPPHHRSPQHRSNSSPPLAEHPHLESPPDPVSGFFSEKGVVEFRLKLGRLLLNESQYRKGATNFQPGGCPKKKATKPAADADDITTSGENDIEKASETTESITVMASCGVPSIHYVWRRPNQVITVTVADAKQLMIESVWPLTGERAVLKQPSTGEIVWTVERGDLNDEFRGPTLLHLYLQDPVGMQMHCGELITRFLRGRSLKKICRQTQRKLLNGLVDHRERVSQSHVMELVEGLRSSRSSRRREASREILRMGKTILPLLSYIIHNEPLDLEQKERLEQIISRLGGYDDDRIATLAAYLENDHTHWTLMARRLSDHQLRLVDARLSDLKLPTVSSSISTNENSVRVASAPR